MCVYRRGRAEQHKPGRGTHKLPRSLAMSRSPCLLSYYSTVTQVEMMHQKPVVDRPKSDMSTIRSRARGDIQKKKEE